jgi:predicted AlkP superfamily pyrophosphatase or phosphodiesterase
MSDHVILLSIPGLRSQDIPHMPHLRALVGQGDQATLVPSFPCVTCPVQANMTTGVLPDQHGVVANGFYWRERHEVEMWTAWNDCILAPQIWDTLHEHAPGTASAVWFPLHSKGCGADYICTPAPKHNPDGTESLWCYTRPESLYPDLVNKLDHFPLQHFWGPLANIFSSEWIADSAVEAARRYRPNFFYIYLPQLDYAAQKEGPDSSIARASVEALDQLLGKFAAEMQAAFPASARLLWLIASEYSIVPVNHVTYPNRVLRAAGLLSVDRQPEGEHLDFVGSKAWALVDHQLAHVFVADRDERTIGRVVDLFRKHDGIAEVLAGDERRKYDLVHERSGDVVLVSQPNSWQAYYWWTDDELAPPFARKVDIHNKPGYDPCEMHIDTKRMGISLDTSLVKGSHGAPANSEAQRGVILASQRGVFDGQLLADIDVHALVLRQFGI